MALETVPGGMKEVFRKFARRHGWTLSTINRDRAKFQTVLDAVRETREWAKWVRMQAIESVAEAGTEMNLWPKGTVAGLPPKVARTAYLDHNGKVMLQLDPQRVQKLNQLRKAALAGRLPPELARKLDRLANTKAT